MRIFHIMCNMLVSAQNTQKNQNSCLTVFVSVFPGDIVEYILLGFHIIEGRDQNHIYRVWTFLLTHSFRKSGHCPAMEFLRVLVKTTLVSSYRNSMENPFNLNALAEIRREVKGMNFGWLDWKRIPTYIFPPCPIPTHSLSLSLSSLLLCWLPS